MKILIRCDLALGNRTALELAVAGKSLEFMSLDGVQEKLQMIWNGENIKTKDESRKDHRCISNLYHRA